MYYSSIRRQYVKEAYFFPFAGSEVKDHLLEEVYPPSEGIDLISV